MGSLTLTWLQDKYPVYSLEIKKNAQGPEIDSLVASLQEKIEQYERVQYIATFDHYTHTSRQPDGEIAADIQDARNLVFCVGRSLPSPLAPALRPRSIGVVEMDDRFVISFMEPPMPLANQIMTECVEEVASSFGAMA